MTTTCACGKPTRDAAYFCETCGDDLAKALGDVPWIAEELETSVANQRAASYNGSAASAEKPSPVRWDAAEARRDLKAVLVSWALFCRDEHVRHSSPDDDLPTDDLTALSRWLLWRVDGLSLHDLGPTAVEEIGEAVETCRRKIDRPPDRQYLGECGFCRGRLYARHGSAWATCESCEARTDAEALRTKLLAELDDRLLSAAEIADLSTYLGLKADRERVRKRVDQWHRRGRIVREPAFSDAPVFRFGIVWRLLVAEDAQKKGA